MASTTTRRPRTTPSTRTARGRARPSARTSRGTTTHRSTTIARGRRKQQPTGLSGLIAKLPDAIPGVKRSGKRSASKNPISRITSALPFGGGAKRGKSSSSGSGRRAGGAALAAGAAGLAIKNRGKIKSMIKREDDAAVTTGGSETAQDASVSRLDVTPSDVATPPQSGSAG
jgi:hypothetical protein